MNLKPTETEILMGKIERALQPLIPPGSEVNYGSGSKRKELLESFEIGLGKYLLRFEIIKR